MRLDVRHDTRYRYTAPVSLAHHLAHLRPLQDAHQRLLAFELTVDPAPSHATDSVDAHGNAQHHFSVLHPHDALAVQAVSSLRVTPRFDALDAAASPAWDALAASLRYVGGAAFRPEVEWVQPSPFVPRLAALAELAREAFVAGRPVAEAALALMRQVHRDFRYDSESTEIDTPLAEVLAGRHGVCQDFAHLTIGALRLLGLPARYVSGYLLTERPGDGAPMVGADASHAWLQVWCPGTPGVPADGWLDLDPTNDVVPADGHVRLAVGRDFGDVTPLRGVIRGGGGSHRLRVAVRTRAFPDEDAGAADGGAPAVASASGAGA